MRVLPKAMPYKNRVCPMVRYELSLEKSKKLPNVITVGLSRTRPELRASIFGIRISKPTLDLKIPIFGEYNPKTNMHGPLAEEMAKGIKKVMRAPSIARASLYGLCAGVNYAAKIALFTLPVAAALLPVSPFILATTAAMCVLMGIMAGVQACLFHRALEKADYNQDRTVINMLRGLDIHRAGMSIVDEERGTKNNPGENVELAEFSNSRASPIGCFGFVVGLAEKDRENQGKINIRVF